MGESVRWTPVTRRLALAARAVGWGRNSLRRTSDRVGYVARLAVVALVAGALLIAVAVGGHAFRRGMATVDAQAAVSRQVTATLTSGAPVFVTLGNRPSTDEVPARWTYAGRQHHGRITAAEGSPAGSTMRIWVNLSGNHIQPPQTMSGTRLRAWLAGAVAFVAAVAVLGAVLWLVEWRLNRARMRRWDREWQQLDPKWTEKTG